MSNETKFDQLRAELVRAVARDLRTQRRRRPKRARGRVRLLASLGACAAVAAPGVAYATGAFTSPKTVAASLPAGSRMLIGSHPTCVAVVRDVEFRCRVAHPPVPYRGPGGTDNKLKPGQHDTTSGIAPNEFKGTIEETVDRTRHVNGGCRSSSRDGSVWECYIGRAAVRNGLIASGLLGQRLTAPSVG